MESSDRPSTSQEVKYEVHLTNRISEINKWASEEGIKVKYVSGLMVTRTNPETGKLEVLLVKGASLVNQETSERKAKDFWQFPGGHVRGGEDHIAALRREIKEELGVSIPNDLFYVKTYVPKPEPGAKEVLAIHAFSLPGNCDWDVKRGNVTLGSDVSEMIWTSDPLHDEKGEPRVLTQQTDYLLRNVMGYEGPANKNTLRDEEYYGDPRE
ncbi:MAG: NUDIX hydrolase [Patescibacteria group bacterium]